MMIAQADDFRGGDMILQLFLAVAILASPCLGWSLSRHGNMLGVSQGVSAPNQNSVINHSRGFTAENPVGVIYQTQGRVTGQYDTSSNRTGMGGEVGIGNGQFGVAGGYYGGGCEECTSRSQAALGVSIGDLALGLRYGSDIYGAGLIFNPRGKHRFGLSAEAREPEDITAQRSSIAAGYSYFGQKFAFTLDASQRHFDRPDAANNVLIVTPGVSVFFNKLSLSLSYDRYVDQGVPGFPRDHIWWGLGYGEVGRWYLNVYNDYINQWSAAFSYYF